MCAQAVIVMVVVAFVDEVQLAPIDFCEDMNGLITRRRRSW